MSLADQVTDQVCVQVHFGLEEESEHAAEDVEAVDTKVDFAGLREEVGNARAEDARAESSDF